MFLLQEHNKQINVLSNVVILPTFQPIRHSSLNAPGTSRGSCDSDVSAPPAKKLCCDVKEVAVQTDINRSSPPEDMLKRKVKVLTQKLMRRDIRLDSLKSLLTLLIKRCNNFDEVEQMLKNNFVEIHKQINTDKSDKGVRYSKEIKQFALSLYFYSPKAYICFLEITLCYLILQPYVKR